MVDILILGLSGIELCIGVAGGLLAYFAWQYRKKRVGRPIVIMALATSGYAFSTALLSFISDPFWWLIVNNIGYPFGAILAIGSFYVVVEFTGRDYLLHPAIGAVCLGFVAVNFTVSMTDPVHNLMVDSLAMNTRLDVETYGPLFFVHVISSLGVVTVAFLLLLTDFPETSGIYRKQMAAVMSGFLLGISGFVVQTFASIHPAIDVATLGIFGWCMAIFWGVFQADFLDLVPIGRRQIVRDIRAPIITLDAENRVIDSNALAQKLARSGRDREGTPVETFFSQYPTLVDAIKAEDTHEVTLNENGRTRHMTLSISPIYSNIPTLWRQQREDIGSVVIMRDVTEQIRRQRKLERMNKQLTRRNDQLVRANKRYQTLFENTPLPLWEKDFSQTMERIEDLNEQTDDLASYLAANPDEHRQLLESVVIRNVNEKAIEAYGASSKAELIDNFPKLITDEALRTSRRLLEQLVDGKQQFREETIYQTVDGEVRHELLSVFVPTENEYSRVLIAGTDITDQKQQK